MEIAKSRSFGASSDWCSSFKCCWNFQSPRLLGKVVSTDEKVTNVFPAVIQKLIEEGGYTLDLIFKFDETSIYYRCMLWRTFISKTGKHAPGFKAAKDCWTVMFVPTPKWDQWATSVHICCYNFLFQITFLPPLRNNWQAATLPSPSPQQTSSLFQGKVSYLL